MGKPNVASVIKVSHLTSLKFLHVSSFPTL